MAKEGFYAVQNGRDGKGIYSSWDQAKAQTNGYSNNVHKKFDSVNDAFKFASRMMVTTTVAQTMLRNRLLLLFN